MDHIMIDIETLGVRPTSVFLSLAAVPFDINTGKTGEVFYKTVDLNSALKAGLTVDASTIQWWMTQDADIRAKMFQYNVSLEQVLQEFSNWIECNTYEEAYLWGNSAAFDLGILGNAYDKLDIPRPWSPWNERCFRTIKSLFGDRIPMINKPKNAHDPVVDCKHQIQVLCKIWQVLKEQNSAHGFTEGATM